MKIIRIFCGSFLLLASLLVISQSATILAQDEGPGEEKIELTATHTKLEGTSGASFEFEIKLKYEGSEAHTFDLLATGSKNWLIYITPSYPKDKRIKDIRLEPSIVGQTILVHAAPPYWLRPEPGEYEIILEASSGGIRGSITVTAVVTAEYTLILVPAEERYNTSATAGKDNPFSMEVENTGSATINDITFSSDKSQGWMIEFSPGKIDSLGVGKSQTINVNIKPPAETIAGDYAISLRASGKEATTDKVEIRVTVETPTIWGWTGIGIILLAIAGLGFVIMRFSRR